MIIVFGTSADDTTATAQEIHTKHSGVFLIQQQSQGIYSAMNEGIDAATGEFLWFMNAGDKFAHSQVLTHAVNEISECGADLLIGGYQIDNDETKTAFSYSKDNVGLLQFAFNRRGGCHQAMIFRSTAIGHVGGYNTSFTLASDFDLVLRIIRGGSAVRIPEIYAEIEPGGRADREIFTVHTEKHLIRKQQFRGPFILLCSLLWTGLARTRIGFRRYFARKFFGMF
jgi:glycosyltransferase involved in cell wall biosynthesis